MLVVMQAHATPEQIENVCSLVRDMGFTPHTMPGANRTAIGITGNPGPVPPATFADLPGVAQAIPVTKPYKLVLREIREGETVIPIGDSARIGEKTITLFAGPCAVETRDLLVEAATAVKKAGAHVLRGGAFKPRTSPYAFQGLGEDGVKLLVEARAETGLPIVTEAMDEYGVDMLERYEIDMIQLGARNMQNYSLLKRLGQSRLPVMLKRGMCATLDELLQAAEYILSSGNYNVVLCERGVRTFASHARNTLDLSAVPVLKRQTHLPVLVDPSHATGNRADVGPMAMAAVAAGADGLMIEVHPHPEKALSDGAQSLRPPEFERLVSDLRLLARAVGRDI